MSRPDRDARRRLSRPRMPGEMGEPVSIGDAAALVGDELGLAEPLVFSRLVEAWPELVGPAIAAHSRVRSVRNGTIEVLVDSPAWASEFRYLESVKLELKDLDFQVFEDQFATVVGSWKLSQVDPEGRNLDQNGQCTFSLCRMSDDWKIVAQHFSPMSAESAATE